MSLGRPSAVITIDGRSLTAAEAALAGLRIEMARGCHDAAELLLWPRSKFADAAPGAVMSIALGNTGDETDVWSGEVTAADAHPEAILLEGLAATVALSRSRRAQTYVGQTVADIVRDLAGEVPVDEAEGEVELAAYSVDSRRSVWGHLNELARLSGADLGSSPDGGLRFLPVREGPATLELRFGADLIAWSVARAPARAARGVAAHGAGSEAGAERWHWLRNDPFGAGASGEVIAAFRTKDAAEALAEALAARAGRDARRGWLRIVGNAEARVGDLVTIDGLPGEDPGALRVVGIRHELDMTTGFVTTLAVEGGVGGGGLLGGLGL